MDFGNQRTLGDIASIIPDVLRKTAMFVVMAVVVQALLVGFGYFMRMWVRNHQAAAIRCMGSGSVTRRDEAVPGLNIGGQKNAYLAR